MAPVLPQQQHLRSRRSTFLDHLFQYTTQFFHLYIYQGLQQLLHTIEAGQIDTQNGVLSNHLRVPVGSEDSSTHVRHSLDHC